MTPITKDPKRRIRRIRRYVSEWGCRVIDNWTLSDRRERLYARELAWLCDYAQRITTDHGRATSRLSEVKRALGRMRAMVHRVVPRLSQYSTHATMADALERAIGELEALLGEKKRR